MTKEYYGPIQKHTYQAISGGYQSDVSQSGRLDRRPLYPHADKTTVWDEPELQTMQRYSFRPLVLAYHEPRFLLDFHSAGGLLGHLLIGVVKKNASKWLHDFSQIHVAFSNGVMIYELDDPEFGDVHITLRAAALSRMAGIAIELAARGSDADMQLIWTVAGASGYFTNYDMDAAKYRFSADDCRANTVALNDGIITLSRIFSPQEIEKQEIFFASRHLPDWRPQVKAGSSSPCRLGYAHPHDLEKMPADALANAVFTGSRQIGGAALAVCPLTGEPAYLVAGMGRNVEVEIRQARQAFLDAVERGENLAGRLVIETPDEQLNASMPLIAHSTEGTWGDTSFLHGAWSWRYGYLGWRSLYGPVCYGFTDRVRQNILNHLRLGKITEGQDKGALSHMLDLPPAIFYNMNEVFSDMLRQYLDYTGDESMLLPVFEAIQDMVSWEERRYRAGDEALYESCLNTWTSDSHWYVRGQCTQASAYMYNAYCTLAGLAPRLGRDPHPFAARAAQIKKDMQDILWLEGTGVFAEYKDTSGERLLHKQPELPTIYHSAEFGAAGHDQVCRMLDWVEEHIRHVDLADGGRLYYSSDWYPNNGRSHTHSTYMMEYGDELNFALTQFLAGRKQTGYAIIKGCMTGIFSGPTPGALGCQIDDDGTMLYNDEFADSISMWGRAIHEGLFGIAPKRLDRKLMLSPMLPESWKTASICSKFFSYQWKHERGQIEVRWQSPVPVSVHVNLPLAAARFTGVQVDGQSAPFEQVRGPSADWVRFDTPVAGGGVFVIQYEAAKIQPGRVYRQLWRGGADAPVERSWKPPQTTMGDLSPWTLIDLNPVFNASDPLAVLESIAQHSPAPPLPAVSVGFEYYLDHLIGRCTRIKENQYGFPPSVQAWRAKTNQDNVAWTTEAIPFLTSKQGDNMAVISRSTKPFRHEVHIPVCACGQALYLMVSLATFPVQSHVPNLTVLIFYEDGFVERIPLVNPFDLSDCWMFWGGRFHDTASAGFENVGGRFGPQGSAQVANRYEPVKVDTQANLICLPLRNIPLTGLTLQATANDVIAALMGASILI